MCENNDSNSRNNAVFHKPADFVDEMKIFLNRNRIEFDVTPQSSFFYIGISDNASPKDRHKCNVLHQTLMCTVVTDVSCFY